MAVPDDLKAYLSALGSSIEGRIELLVNSLGPELGPVFRLCAIPHRFDEAILKALWPEHDGRAPDALARIESLGSVINSGDQFYLHDDVRTSLLDWWRRPENIGAFRAASGRLANHLAEVALVAQGSEKAEAQSERIFHQLGADAETGFRCFDAAYRTARLRRATAQCQSLLKLAEEASRGLSPAQRLELKYRKAELLVDTQDWENAEITLNGILRDPDAPVKLRALATYRLASLLAEKGAMSEALGAYKEAARMARIEPDAREDLPQILDGLGNAQRRRGREIAARNAFVQALEVAAELHNGSQTAAIFYSLGVLERQQGHSRKAIAFFKQSQESLGSERGTVREAQLLIAMSAAYADLAEWGDSVVALTRSKEISAECGDTRSTARAEAGLMRFYIGRAALFGGEEARELTQKALEAGEAALKLSLEVRDWEGAASLLRQRARIQRRRHEELEAQRFFSEAEMMFRRAGCENDALETAAERARIKPESIPWYAWVVLLLPVALIVAIFIYL